MYEMSPEDARSDLMLSGAVFVFGPTALRLLLGVVGMSLVFGGTAFHLVHITVAVLCTMLVPLLLMKYRNERPAVVLGLGSGDRSLAPGLLAAAPLLVAGVVQVAVGGSPLAAHPVLALAGGDLLGLIARLVSWVGAIGLALYATVKARDAFGGLPTRLTEAAWRIGRILAIAAAVTTVLSVASVLLGDARPPLAAIGVVVWPLAVATSVVLVLRPAGPATTALPVLVTPTVVCAVGNFLLTFSAADLIATLHATVLSGGVGLAVGILAERSRRGGGVLLLALLIALGTGLSAPLRLFG